MKAIICTSYFIFFILLSCNDTNEDYHDELTLISERIDKIELTLKRIDSILTLNDEKYQLIDHSETQNIDSLIKEREKYTLDFSYEEPIDSSMQVKDEENICKHLDIQIKSIRNGENARIMINGASISKFIKKNDIILDINNEEFEIIEISADDKSIKLKHIKTKLICIEN